MLLLVIAVLFGAADYCKGDPAAASLGAIRSKSHSPEGGKASSFTVHASAGEHSQKAQGDFVAKVDAFVVLRCAFFGRIFVGTRLCRLAMCCPV